MSVNIHAVHVTDGRPDMNSLIEVALARDDDPNTWMAMVFVDDSGESISTQWSQCDVDGHMLCCGTEPSDEEVKQVASEAARAAWERELQPA